jgi:solute carrier family 35 (UDP-sugar transporter), member A1/2/3
MLLSIFTIQSPYENFKWPKSDDSTKGTDKNFNEKLVGLLAVLFACFSSGFAGVYFEKLLKGSSTGVWTRNIQLGTFINFYTKQLTNYVRKKNLFDIFCSLGFFGTIIGFFSVYSYDYVAVTKDGFFQGYNTTVWVVVALQVLN